MKKFFLLVVAVFLSVSLYAAPTKKCYGESVKFTTTKSGDSYQWYKDNTKINGATQKSYTATGVTKDGTYKCVITTNGTSANTGNLISLGNFEFNNESKYKRYTQHISDPVRGDSYNIEYQLDQLNLSNQANSGEYCTSTNPNNIKPQYFYPITAKEGSKMLVVDGAASSSEFKVFYVRNLKLKGGVTYQFSCWAANIDKEYFTMNHGIQSLPKIKFVIEADGHGTQVLGGGYMTLTDQLGVWKEYKATFTPSHDCNWAHITVVNTTNTTVAGNDFVLDGLYFGAERTSGPSTEEEEFELKVYDNFKVSLTSPEVCPGESATITSTIKGAHNGTLEPEIDRIYKWIDKTSINDVGTSANLTITAPTTIGTYGYELNVSGKVCSNVSTATSIKVKDCGSTETINHPAVTVCTNQNVTLKCDKTGNSVTWNDPSLTGTEVTVTSSSSVGAEDKYTCTITTTVSGNTVTYIENFTVKTKDCSVLYESTMCNTAADSTLKASKTGTNYEYHWTLPNGTTRITETDTIQIKPTNANVGEVLEYSCEIYEIQSHPAPSVPTLANNIIENGGFEDISNACPYNGFTSDYECYKVDESFNLGLIYRGFMRVTKNDTYGITPASGTYMLECDGDLNEKAAWIASTANNPRLEIKKGTQYQFSYKAAMLGNINNPKLTFYIEYNGKKDVLVTEQELPNDSKWHTYGEGIYWTAPEDCNNVKLSLVDKCNSNSGNDFCLDDIMFQPLVSAPNAGVSPMLLGTDNFEITIRDCIVETDDEEELQVKEDGSITLIVPEANRCDDCTYTWYKRNEDGSKGEAVAKNAGEEAWEHTVYNATADEYMCEIITPNGNKHTQTYKISVYTPKTSTYCFTEDSEEDQKATITLTKGDIDEYEWYWNKNNELIPFPESAISTENNNITLDLAYFVNDNNSQYPVYVHIVEKFAHKLEVSNTEVPETPETPEDNTNTNVNPAPVVPSPEPTPEPEPSTTPTTSTIPDVNINSSAFSKSNMTKVDNNTYTYKYNINTEDGEEITITDSFIISPSSKYNETYPSKTANMASHDCNVRLTNTGINGCSAYKVDEPNNEYFIEVDGGDTEGPVFSINQKTKIIKGKKYSLRFLARETSTVAGDPKTTNPAKIDFHITLNGHKHGITELLTMDKQEWTLYEFDYTANEDAEEVTITLSNYTTTSGHNDFAIDEITFTLKPEGRNATSLNNDEVVDEDGDGYVMWQDEHILIIYPNTTQTITEVSSPHKEYEKEVTLPMGEKINFRYDPNIYDGAMTKYEANDYKVDEYGCKHSVYFTLNLMSIEPMVFFTPNNDGVNDLWLIKGIETAPNSYITIYDRHSKLLYKSKGSDFKGWDGKYNGHEMVQDDYWYVISIPETEEQISGHFILKR